MDKTIENSTDNVTSGNGLGWGYGAFMADIPSRTVTLQNSADVRRDVLGVESELRETILEQTISQDKEFRNLNQEILKAHYENRLENAKQTCEIKEKIDDETEEIKEQLRTFEKSVDEKFCALEKRELETENNRLRDELADCKATGANAQVMAALFNISAALGITIPTAKKS